MERVKPFYPILPHSVKNLCLSFYPLRSVCLISLKILCSTVYDVDILFIEKVIMAVFQTITIPLCPQFPRAIPRISFNSEIDYKCDIIFLTGIEYVNLSGEPQSSSSSISEPQCPNVPVGEENSKQNGPSYAAGVNWLRGHRSDVDFCQLRRLLCLFYLSVKTFSEIVCADCLSKLETCQEFKLAMHNAFEVTLGFIASW